MKWNKTNTVILAIMIIIVSTIGINKGDLPHRRDNMDKADNVAEQMQSSDDLSAKINENKKDMMKNALVHIEMGAYMGSGLIWEKNTDQIVIASNKHLLLSGEQATVTFANGCIAEGQVVYCSTEYDLGFLTIHTKELEQTTYEELSTIQIPNSEELWKSNTLLGLNVIQYSAEDKNRWTKEEGYILGYEFIPEFYCDMLQTQCYAKAGMSGGGVFSEDGLLLGMVSGGDVANENKEAEVTYSLSALVIQQEFLNMEEIRENDYNYE